MKRKTLSDACNQVRAKSVRNEATGCLEYKGRADDCGYGWVYFAMTTDRTHRVIWMEASGAIPEGNFCVMHSCDNPCCVEISHLSLGTKKANAVDMVHKCRSLSQKVSPDDVRDIRALAFYGAEPVDVAASYGIQVGAVERIINRTRWAHLAA